MEIYNMKHGTWNVEHGAWSIEHGTWDMDGLTHVDVHVCLHENHECMCVTAFTAAPHLRGTDSRADLLNA